VDNKDKTADLLLVGQVSLGTCRLYDWKEDLTLGKLRVCCGLNEQIHNNGRRILDLFSQSKIKWSDFLVDLKVQSTQSEEQRTTQMFKPFVELRGVEYEFQTR
jgi:hypothetical protein